MADICGKGVTDRGNSIYKALEWGTVNSEEAGEAGAKGKRMKEEEMRSEKEQEAHRAGPVALGSFGFYSE